MKKTISILIATLMLMTLVPVISNVSLAKAANGNVANAVFIAVRWAPNGQRWSGGTLVIDNNRRFNIDSGTFGRIGYPMTDNQGLEVSCYLWTEFFLDVVPAAGMSQESNRWIAILDSAGQIWFDRDNYFNNSRYYEFADPWNPNYGDDPTTTIDNCQINPHARRDPSTANNTQGPYMFPLGNVTGPVSLNAWRDPVYFSDPQTWRTFRLGFGDRVARNIGIVRDPRAIRDVWDEMAPLEPFLDGYDMTFLPPPPAPPASAAPDWAVWYNPNNYFRTVNLPDWNFGEEWHSASGARSVGPANMVNYVYGDWIYRKGAVDAGNLVAGYDWQQTLPGGQAVYPHYYGATRLTPVIGVTGSGRVVRFASGTAVRDTLTPGTIDPGDDADVGVPVYRFPLNDNKFTIGGGYTGLPYGTPAWAGGTVGETVHLMASWGRNGIFDYSQMNGPNGSYNVAEGIYEMRSNSLVVTQTDFRLTPWTTGLEFITEVGRFVQPADVLILSEVLRGGCASPFYNVSVETDIWESTMPSTTYAAIRTPNGEVPLQVQNVQKSTVLGPKPSEFNVPATTFQNIKFEYREYLGIEIFLDNGVDNNLGPDQSHVCIPNDASDDYWPGATGELYMGAVDNEHDADIGLGFDPLFGRQTSMVVLPLSDFWQQDMSRNPGFGAPVRFFDTNTAVPIGNGGGYGITNTYGCKEALYRDIDYLLPATPGVGAFEISQGDVRLTEVIVVRRDLVTGSRTIITYPAGSTVAIGDADVNLNAGIGPMVDYDPTGGPPFQGGNDLSAFYDKYYDWDPANYFVWTRAFPNQSSYEPVWLDWRHPDPLDSKKWIEMNLKYDRNEFIYDGGPRFDTQGWFFSGLQPSLPNGYGTVAEGFLRLTDVSYAGKFYNCGSTCSLYDMWAETFPVTGITYGQTGDRRFMDMEVLPGSTGSVMEISREFQVEMTTHVKITMDPPPKAGYWDAQTWVPDERAYVLFQGIGKYIMGQDMRNLNNILFECTPQRPIVEFEFTPYRGSCNSLGRTDMPDPQDGRLTTYVLRDNGGQKPAPPDGYYGDLFWDWVGLTNTEVGQKFYDRHEGNIVPWRQDDWTYRMDGQIPYPPVPADLQNSYDCVDVFKHNVAPEKLDLTANRLCITTLDQRFPNLMVKLTDADNPNDVNDPAGIPFSIPYDFGSGSIGETNPNGSSFHANIVNYNCHGGGIAWMAVAVPTDRQMNYKYIIQYHTDGTYYYWYWYEPRYFPQDPIYPQISWALDPTDYLFGEVYTGNFPVPSNTSIKKTPVFVDSRVSLEDVDCSQGTGYCDPCLLEGIRPLGDVTGVNGFPNRSDRLGIFDGSLGYIVQYGVPTYVSGYGQLTPSDPGGECMLAVRPRDGTSHLFIRIYSTDVIFDYNSTIAHPNITNGAPYFVWDKMISGEPHKGIDYCGTLDLKVYPPDPYVNFAEFTIVDHGLQFSRIHYTSGNPSAGYTGPLAPLKIPTPQIQSPYDPVLRYVSSEFKCYPGGQTHTGRATGQVWGNFGGPFGWNAYPAIWSRRMNERLLNEQFGKLGTEFFPLTDYGFYFIVKDGEGRHLSFNPDWDVDRRMVKMEIVGPFAVPKVMNYLTNSVVSTYEYNGMRQVPIQYDWSGKITIDQTNYKQFEHTYVRADWNGDGSNDPYTPYQGIPNENRLYRQPNARVGRMGNLNFSSLGWGTPVGPGLTENTDNVVVIDEVIPWQPGKILIYVTLEDGTFKMYQDCCTAPPVDGVDVHALGINYVISEDEKIKHVPLGIDNKIEVTINETEPMQAHPECNDAVAYVWQDRGVKHIGQDYLFGAGDGWVTNPPGSTRFYYGRGDGNAAQYDTTWDDQLIDINGDAKVSFADWETEICGTYNMATNTWSTGLIDARTFQRNGGLYVFELSESNGARVDISGLDFGGEEGISDPPDHIISDKELLPLYITAYKYGDDNNDRAFSPFWDMSPLQDTFNFDAPTTNRMRYSHEVYVAGQVAVPVEPEDDLIVSMSTPKVLTAGITPELISPDTPLTLEVKWPDGKPVDLGVGIKDVRTRLDTVKEEHIWNYLFKDPNPDNTYYNGRTASLPQYYFVRTNLHNRDLERDNNEELYSVRTLNIADCADTLAIPFRPIKIDFSQAASGKYVFRGFCANDVTVWKGEQGDPAEEKWLNDHQFIVHVYTPDRKHRGTVILPIESPKASYEMVNVEDPNQTFFSSPGDPDFVMTAGDNRVYKIRVTITDAEGRLVKGVTKGVSVCGGGVKNTARFTPFVTRPSSFDFEFNPCQGTPCGSKIYPHVGFDFDASEKKDGMVNAIDPGNNEFFMLGGFTLASNLTYQKCRDRVESGYTEYNTTCFWFRDDNTWEVDYVNPRDPTVKGWAINKKLPPNLEFSYSGASEPLARGWGLGNIYNYPYWGGALFSDIDANGRLDYHDALGLDVNAQTEFYIYAEDVCFVGGLIGDNTYVNNLNEADVAGYPPRFRTDPREIYRRFRHTISNDQTFLLDWEAWPDHVAAIQSPMLKVLEASTGNREEYGKTFLNSDNYDLVYDADNHMIIEAYPADVRDMPLHEDGYIMAVGNQHQQAIYGRTKKSTDNDKVMETTLHFTPTGTGEATAYMYYLAKNKFFCSGSDICDQKIKMVAPEFYGVKCLDFDVGKGLKIEVWPYDKLTPKASAKILIKVTEFGTGAVVSGAKVKLSGLGVDVTKTTNNKGEVEVEVAPASTGYIKVEASAENYKNTSTTVMVGADKVPPQLDVDPVVPITNQDVVAITGTTESGATVTINGKPATTQANGKFKGDAKLQPGKNVITVVATDGSGNTTSKVVYVTLDKEGPAIMIDKFAEGNKVADKETIMLKGRVDPNSKVVIKDEAGALVGEAVVVHDIWQLENIRLAPAPSRNKFRIEATDLAGNMSFAEIEILNVKRLTLTLTKNSMNATLNGADNALPGAPTGNELVTPMEFLKLLEGITDYNTSTGALSLQLNGHTLTATTGKTECQVDGTNKMLVTKPEYKNGIVWVPAADVARFLGCIVTTVTDAQSAVTGAVIIFEKMP